MTSPLHDAERVLGLVGSSPDTERRVGSDSASAILVVDDTVGNRYVVTRLLRGAGMRVVEAETGKQALDLMEPAPDLVVLDINLPDMTGYDVCRAIKQDPMTASIPVMHLSASYTANSDRAFGLEAGADAYLTHPVDPALFLATVRALLRAGQAEAKLRRAAHEWRTTFDAIADPIFLLDATGTVRRCNRAAAELLGREPREVVFRAWTDVISEMPSAPGLELAGVIDGPPLRDLEVAIRDRWFRVWTSRAAGASPAEALIVCVLADISQRKAAERERETLLEHTERARHEAEASRAEAEAANRAKSDFLAVMSHELRTPLNAIAGFVDLISLGIRGPVTPEQLVDLEKIRRSQVTLMSLINDLLAFAKLESGSVEFETSNVSIDQALTSAAQFVEPQVLARGIRYRQVSCAPDLVALADGEKVQQVLLNLLSNAIKFTDPGGEITVSCEAVGDLVQIHVTDTGRGIPADKLAAIFDPFVQVDQRLVRDQQGVGLGLSISRDLARGMRGDLLVASELGKGSTFPLVLPRG